MGSSSGEKFNLKWNDFQVNVLSSYKDLRRNVPFHDITLICHNDDNSQPQQQTNTSSNSHSQFTSLKAHKWVLSSSSTFFHDLFSTKDYSTSTTANTSSQQCMLGAIYMNEISSTTLKYILDFIYCGEVSVRQEDLDAFISVAERLKIKGLTRGDETDDTVSTPVSHCSNVIKVDPDHNTNAATSQIDSYDFATKRKEGSLEHNHTTGSECDGFSTAKKGRQMTPNEVTTGEDTDSGLKFGSVKNEFGRAHVNTAGAGDNDAEIVTLDDADQSCGSAFYGGGEELDEEEEEGDICYNEDDYANFGLGTSSSGGGGSMPTEEGLEYEDWKEEEINKSCYKKHSEDDKKKLQICAENGGNWKRLADGLHIPYSTAWRWIKIGRFAEKRSRGGKNKKLHEAQIKTLHEIVEKEPRLTHKQIVKKLNDIDGVSISQSTIGNYVVGKTLKSVMTIEERKRTSKSFKRPWVIKDRNDVTKICEEADSVLIALEEKAIESISTSLTSDEIVDCSLAVEIQDDNMSSSVLKSEDDMPSTSSVLSNSEEGEIGSQPSDKKAFEREENEFDPSTN